MFEHPRDMGRPPGAGENPILFGRYGLRAGWSLTLSIFLYYLLMMVLSPIFLSVTGTMQQAVHQSEALERSKTTQQPLVTAPGLIAANEGALLTAVGLSTFVMACIERRRLSWFGLGKNRVAEVLPGAFWGLATLSLLVLMLYRNRLLVFDGLLLHGAMVYLYGAKWLLTFLLVGVFEEYSIRGYLQYTLMRGLFGLAQRIAPGRARALAFWMSAVMMSVVFGWLHRGNPGETAPGIAMVFLAGLLFSYALWRTGSLWWAIGFHMAWDWAQSFLWGVPDSGGLSAGRLFQTHAVGSAWLSGGADGPEGSVLVLPTLLLVAVMIRCTTRSAAQPPLEPEEAIAGPMVYGRIT